MNELRTDEELCKQHRQHSLFAIILKALYAVFTILLLFISPEIKTCLDWCRNILHLMFSRAEKDIPLPMSPDLYTAEMGQEVKNMRRI
jgi:hypothetical protein